MKRTNLNWRERLSKSLPNRDVLSAHTWLQPVATRAVFPKLECLHGLSARKSAENCALDNEVLVNHSVAHAELIATFRRAQVDADYKFGLIKAVEKKGLKAI